MPGTSQSPRWQALLLIGFVLACAAFLVLRFWPRDNLQNLLGLLPEDSAVQLYIDVPSAVSATGPVGFPLPLRLSLSASGLEAIAFGLAGQDLYLAAGGRFGAGLIEAALARQGVRCDESIAETPCHALLEHGTVSVSMLSDGIVFGTTEVLRIAPVARPVAVDKAQAALDGGAVAWAEIDPQLLDQAMETPPSNWLNVQLIARALEPAHIAYATLTPTPEGAFSLELEAHCAVEDTEQLRNVLKGLNDMTIALVAQDAEARTQWEPILKSFESNSEGQIVRVSWILQAADLAALWLVIN
jgi:hypothetical protein